MSSSPRPKTTGPSNPTKSKATRPPPKKSVAAPSIPLECRPPKANKATPVSQAQRAIADLGNASPSVLAQAKSSDPNHPSNRYTQPTRNRSSRDGESPRPTGGGWSLRGRPMWLVLLCIFLFLAVMTGVIVAIVLTRK